MKTTKFLFSIISISMWMFLLHEILSILAVDRLVWFIYWTYVPVSLLTAIFTILVIKAELEITKN